MIEREFVKQNKKEFQVQEYVANNLKNVGISHIKMQRTPLGEKIIVFASKPGLVVGREGRTIKNLTIDLKRKFKFENPQIEISEVENPPIDAKIVAENIASSLERFGIKKFKGIGHKAMADAINSGARGIEILISGKIPGARAKTWRFYKGYLKKCGEVASTGIDTAYETAKLKIGIIGVQVRIMPPSTKLPDDIKIKQEKAKEEIKEEKKTPEEEGNVKNKEGEEEIKTESA